MECLLVVTLILTRFVFEVHNLSGSILDSQNRRSYWSIFIVEIHHSQNFSHQAMAFDFTKKVGAIPST